jgi:hypothetical protein
MLAQPPNISTVKYPGGKIHSPYLHPQYVVLITVWRVTFVTVWQPLPSLFRVLLVLRTSYPGLHSPDIFPSYASVGSAESDLDSDLGSGLGRSLMRPNANIVTSNHPIIFE